MGFYLRKSLKAGPFRFNFSKSGIGVSVGVKGLRIGTGPRGNYIHAGVGGFYYRASLSPQSKTIPKYNSKYDTLSYDDLEKMHEIDSESVLEMKDSSAEALLEEINEKHKKISLFPITIVFSIIALFISFNSTSSFIHSAVFILGLSACLYTKYIDDINKSVILFYDFEPKIEKSYQKLHDDFNSLTNCHKTWHIEAQGNIMDVKYNAGANSRVKRSLVNLKVGQPPFIKTNISVPIIPVGRQILYFFPERVLVFDAGKVGAVNYDSLIVNIENTRFVEEEGVPRDAIVVDKTWRFVNRDGGPDRRFNNNYSIPVAQYETVHFKSNSGLNELLYLSKLGITMPFKQTIIELSKISKKHQVIS